MEPKVEFAPGDSIVITSCGCNNSSAPEYIGSQSIAGKSDKVYVVKRVETEGRYNACDRCNSDQYYTLILNTGHPVWAFHCKRVSPRQIFPIF